MEMVEKEAVKQPDITERMKEKEVRELDITGQLKAQVMERLDISRELPDQEILGFIDEAICRKAKEIPLSLTRRRKLRTEVFYSLRRLDILQELLEEDDITEIMVNGSGSIFYEKSGKIHRWQKSFSSREKLEDVIQQIAAGNNRIVNEYSPIVDTRLEDGSRVNIVLEPIAIDGSCISIRKFPKRPITMQDMIDIHSVNEEITEFLKKLVKARYNIFISGGTGSGKTTFLNALSAYIPAEERIVTIEDSAELQIQNIPNLVRLETRNASLDTGNEISIRDLIKTSLRMRPDRIIVGEIRGAEALDMLQAMNTGHPVRASYRQYFLFSHMIIKQRMNVGNLGENVCLSMQNIYRQVLLPV